MDVATAGLRLRRWASIFDDVIATYFADGPAPDDIAATNATAATARRPPAVSKFLRLRTITIRYKRVAWTRRNRA
jgi:hypothetical protein